MSEPDWRDAQLAMMHRDNERLRKALKPFAILLDFIEAGAELEGVKYADSNMVASYQGHGATHFITMADLRAAHKALREGSDG